MILHPTVLIVDDEKNTADGLVRYLEAHDFEPASVLSAEEALESLERSVPDIVLSDLKLGTGMDGMGLLQAIQEKGYKCIVVLMTAYGTVENAVAAMKIGAYHYLTKPINLEELVLVLKNAISKKVLERENEELKRQIRESMTSQMIMGTSKIFKSIYQEALQVAKSNASVLIEGESGTGKELMARLIHDNSERATKPFVAVHCAALNENLMESELFGHEKGAFTGASERKIGRFEKAHQGTIFLDEIGEINQATQIKLLRVLQEGEFERVGGTKTIKADVRILAATNKNLIEEIQKGNFRDDLYYRINVIALTMPALRERPEDIREIFKYYVQKFAVENNKKVRLIEEEVFRQLEGYSWPGNIRELRNTAERTVVLLKGDIIKADHLLANLQAGIGFSGAGSNETNLKISEMEKEMIQRQLKKNNGNKTNAAKALGISRRTLYRKMEEYGLS